MKSVENSFEIFKTELFQDWKKRLSRMYTLMAALVTACEIGIYLYFISIGNLKGDDILPYFFLRVLTPIVINVGTLIYTYYVLKSHRYDETRKNYTLMGALYELCSVVAIFHNFFNFLLVTLTLPVYLCSVFADKKLLNRIFFASMGSFVLAMVFFFKDKVGFDLEYRVTTMFSCFVYMIVTYVVSKTHLYSQEEQIKYIYSGYRRQNELIEELKIEPLTHLYNRTALDETIKSTVARYTPSQMAPIIALIDLDHFKKINDTYGHAAGDKVLINLSSIIQKHMGGTRNAFRFGGEEFVIIFDKSTDEQCYSAIKNIKDDYAESSYDFAPGVTFTLSAGIVKLREGWSTYDWFDQVDSAMYESKQNGRNKITVK